MNRLFPRIFNNFKMLFLGICFLSSLSANAQSLIPPINPDVFLTGTASNTEANINADVIGSAALEAFVWDATQYRVGVTFSNFISNVTFMIPQGSSADVALANDMTNLNNVIAGIIYLYGDKVIFDTYTINYSTLSYTQTSQQVMNYPAIGSGSGYGFPHIDMFADDTTGVGVSLMHRFVISWTEHDLSTNTYSIKAAHGDIASPTTYTSTTIRQANAELYDDVAASNTFVGSNPHLNAYFIIENDDNNSLEFRSWNCTTGALGTLTTLSSNKTFLPRIEAMGLDDPSLSNNSWAAVAPLWNGSSYDVYVFDNNFLTGLPASTPVFSGWDNRHVAIAAGIGPSHPELCSLNYYFGWGAHNGNNSMFVSRGVSYYSGNFTDFNFYRINTGLFNPIIDKVPLAMTSFSNSGKALVTAWQRPGNTIYYKLTTTNVDYKPAPLGIGVIDDATFAVSPNPAHNQLMIQSATAAIYTISNLTGQILLSGKLTGNKEPIDIHQLSSGMYWVQIQSGAETQHQKFIKL